MYSFLSLFLAWILLTSFLLMDLHQYNSKVKPGVFHQGDIVWQCKEKWREALGQLGGTFPDPERSKEWSLQARTSIWQDNLENLEWYSLETLFLLSHFTCNVSTTMFSFLTRPFFPMRVLAEKVLTRHPMKFVF